MGSVEMIKQIITGYVSSDKSDAEQKRGKGGREAAVLQLITGKFGAALTELFCIRMILDLKVPENAVNHAEYLQAFAQAIGKELNYAGAYDARFDEYAAGIAKHFTAA